MTDTPIASTRRNFLKLSISAAPAMVVGTHQAAAADAAAAYVPVYFTALEWAFLRAAAARLIPADDLVPGAVEAGVPEFIDKQMATPWAEGRLWYMQGPFAPDAPATMGWQSKLVPREVYRLGIQDANGWTQQTYGALFADLSPDQQIEALQKIESGEASFAQVPAKTFFSILLANVREGFFSDPRHGGNRNLVGWTLIGFPGARADFMDWVDRDVAYPLPPVSIDGKRG